MLVENIKRINMKKFASFSEGGSFAPAESGAAGHGESLPGARISTVVYSGGISLAARGWPRVFLTGVE